MIVMHWFSTKMHSSTTQWRRAILLFEDHFEWNKRVDVRRLLDIRGEMGTLERSGKKIGYDCVTRTVFSRK